MPCICRSPMHPRRKICSPPENQFGTRLFKKGHSSSPEPRYLQRRVPLPWRRWGYFCCLVIIYLNLSLRVKRSGRREYVSHSNGDGYFQILLNILPYFFQHRIKPAGNHLIVALVEACSHHQIVSVGKKLLQGSVCRRFPAIYSIPRISSIRNHLPRRRFPSRC